jgi:hypothetical protein
LPLTHGFALLAAHKIGFVSTRTPVGAVPETTNVPAAGSDGRSWIQVLEGEVVQSRPPVDRDTLERWSKSADQQRWAPDSACPMHASDGI